MNELNEKILAHCSQNYSSFIDDIQVTKFDEAFSANLIGHSSEKVYYKIRFKVHNEVQYCKLCKQLHSVDKREKPKEDSTNLIERINANTSINLLANKRENLNAHFINMINNKSNASLLAKENSQLSKSENLKLKLDNLMELTNDYQDFTNNYERNVRNKCEHMLKQVNQVADEYLASELQLVKLRLTKELDEFSRRCQQNVDRESSMWKEIESFLHVHQIDCQTIDFYLNKTKMVDPIELDKQNEDLMMFEKQLNEKRKQFESHVFMDKQVLFRPQLSTSISKNEILAINCITTCPLADQISQNNFNQYEHILDRIKGNDAQSELSMLNKLVYSAVIKKHPYQLITVHALDVSLLVCNRYALSSQSNDINCDLILYDLYGKVKRQLSIDHTLVRCIQANNKYVLLSVETDNQSESGQCSFGLNLYDDNLNLIKSVQIRSDLTNDDSPSYPLALCLDENRFYLFKNTMPYVLVFDTDLNIVNKFGQDLDRRFNFYMNKNVNNVFVRNQKLYLQYKQDENTTLLNIVDINSGLNCLTISLKYRFHNFYVLSNQQILFMHERNKLALYDLDKQELMNEVELQLADRQSSQFEDHRPAGVQEEVGENSVTLITSFTLNDRGFLSVSYFDKFFAGIY
jgi:hypothetical protein